MYVGMLVIELSAFSTLTWLIEISNTFPSTPFDLIAMISPLFSVRFR